MGRPSRQGERREQILDACEWCMIRHGFAGATLQAVADRAGLARPLVRHNVGNIDELREATVERYLQRSRASADAFFASLTADDPAQALLEALFYADEESQSDDSLLAGVLIAAGRSDPALDARMNDWTEGFVEQVATVLERARPAADAPAAYEVAVGVVALYFNIEALSPTLQYGPMGEASYAAAQRLLASLPCEESP